MLHCSGPGPIMISGSSGPKSMNYYWTNLRMLLITQNSPPTSQVQSTSVNLHSRPLALEVWGSLLRPRSSPGDRNFMSVFILSNNSGKYWDQSFEEVRQWGWIRRNPNAYQLLPVLQESDRLASNFVALTGESSYCLRKHGFNVQELEVVIKYFWKYLSHRGEQQVRDMQIKFWKSFKNLNNVLSMDGGCKYESDTG